MLYIAAGRMGDGYLLRMVTKPIPVLCLALWVSLLPRRGRYQLAVAVGLLLCALGDILLEASDATFLFGLIAFLLGHVAYIVAFTRDSRRLLPAGRGAGLRLRRAGLRLSDHGRRPGRDGGPGAGLHGGDLRDALAGVGACRRGGDRACLGAGGLAGALFFTASDTVLSLRMFDTPINLGGVVVMLTYWIGQTLIAFSARDANPAR